MAEYHTIASRSEIPDGHALRVEIEDKIISVWNINGTLYAIDDICTHEEAYLSEGDLLPDCRVMCALHGAEFDLRTGQALCLPATRPVATYPVQIIEGAIQIEV
jgi:3-phenylpropionate/trans-cinnamate dioxygenase ferredoxin component